MDGNRKRLLYRATHRGMKELDVIIGRFARREVGSMTEKELVAFGALLDMPEPELLSWIVSGEEAPPLLQPWIDKLRNV